MYMTLPIKGYKPKINLANLSIIKIKFWSIILKILFYSFFRNIENITQNHCHIKNKEYVSKKSKNKYCNLTGSYLIKRDFSEFLNIYNIWQFS
jgi:hypothetical protein